MLPFRFHHKLFSVSIQPHFPFISFYCPLYHPDPTILSLNLTHLSFTSSCSSFLQLTSSSKDSPAISEEMMRGRMNILRSRMRISPGKDTSKIVPSEKFASRPRNPRKQPIKTPAMVRTKSMFSPVHLDICKHTNMF